MMLQCSLGRVAGPGYSSGRVKRWTTRYKLVGCCHKEIWGLAGAWESLCHTDLNAYLGTNYTSLKKETVDSGHFVFLM